MTKSLSVSPSVRLSAKQHASTSARLHAGQHASTSARPYVSSFAACAFIPQFALRCEEMREPESRGKPSAVLSADDSRRVWQVSASARKHGVKQGQTVSQAIGLCATLRLFEPDPVFYDEAFTALIRSFTDVTPVIEPADLGQVFLGVDGIERLYGGPERQLAVVRHVARRHGSLADHLRLGWGRGKFVAWVAAVRAGERVSGRADDQSVRLSASTPARQEAVRLYVRTSVRPTSRPHDSTPTRLDTIIPDTEAVEYLKSQPITTLPVETDTQRRMWHLGIRKLKDLIAIPEVAVISQFGNEGHRAWLLARGDLVEPVVGKHIPDPIVAEYEFPDAVNDSGILSASFGRLVDKCLKHPRRIGWRIYRLRVRAALEQGTSWLGSITLKTPTAFRQDILNAVVTKLTLNPPTGAVTRITVEFTEFARGTEELQLFARDSEASARAGQRRALRWAAHEIKTRLRKPLLYHVVAVSPESRIPERRYALIDY